MYKTNFLIYFGVFETVFGFNSHFVSLLTKES